MAKFRASGSNGFIEYDETGSVVRREGYDDITRVDVAEYLAYNGELDDTDILLVGYWTTDGGYEPPVDDHRKLLAEESPEYEAARLNRCTSTVAKNTQQ